MTTLTTNTFSPGVVVFYGHFGMFCMYCYLTRLYFRVFYNFFIIKKGKIVVKFIWTFIWKNPSNMTQNEKLTIKQVIRIEDFNTMQKISNIRSSYH